MIAASLQFAGVSRRFGPLRALVDASGEVAAGGVLSVRGPNGCGKSTLLRCLAGLLRPDRGTIAAREGGRELASDERRSRVGYVAPDVAFYDELSGRENLRLYSRLRGLPPGRGEILLERLGLAGERPFHAMSSGMRQRLRWAFALLHAPDILLLDEPFQNFDAAGERAARELLAERLAAGALAVVASPSDVALPRVTGELLLGG
ncbi:MAG TPA: ABC transporter ATP-binding protein [Thermoanaerobaculia bacterium]|jgi:ABC-type multidrug transport system ATPase subunit